ncbi:MAG TPA: hypothetical protein DIU20_00180, partial [Cryomorphaceae bacterium]|nr:hypothetical protein [Cryomorphaceae bacterium]
FCKSSFPFTPSFARVFIAETTKIPLRAAMRNRLVKSMVAVLQITSVYFPQVKEGFNTCLAKVERESPRPCNVPVVFF